MESGGRYGENIVSRIPPNKPSVSILDPPNLLESGDYVWQSTAKKTKRVPLHHVAGIETVRIWAVGRRS